MNSVHLTSSETVSYVLRGRKEKWYFARENNHIPDLFYWSQLCSTEEDSLWIIHHWFSEASLQVARALSASYSVLLSQSGLYRESVVYSHGLSHGLYPLLSAVNAAALHQAVFSLTDLFSD